MADQSNFMLNLSILYRNTQKYFDKMLAKYDIGSGQLLFLLIINENEGITMQEVTRISEVDKGTTTKSVQKLMEQGYVQALVDEKDHRIKRMHTTAKAAGIIRDIYEVRNQCRSLLAKDMDFATFESMLEKACENARESLLPEALYADIKIGGIQKMTLLDYPEHVACTVFTAGCNFKCPYCHNRDLVFIPENYQYFNPKDIMSYLEKRKNLLDGVCISGGEPLIQGELQSFVKRIKDLGYLVKLDTNGSYPEQLVEIVDSGLVDYVAMDIKNVKEKYAETVGMEKNSFDTSKIEKSIDYLLQGNVDYEFRTTVVREFHTEEDLQRIAKKIQNAKHYYLQQYMESINVIQQGFHAYDKNEMEQILKTVREFVPSAQLRGIKE